MARKSKPKPKNPILIATEKARKALEQRVRDFGAVNLPTEAAQLATYAEVEVRRESQKNAETARRPDAFDALKAGMAPGAYDAVRRLERDMLVRTGLADRPPSAGRVDCTAGFTSDAALKAAQNVDLIKELLSPRDWWLITDLLATSRPWRERVAYISGESHEHAQAAAVRAACINLRDVRVGRERMNRRAA